MNAFLILLFWLIIYLILSIGLFLVFVTLLNLYIEKRRQQ